MRRVVAVVLVDRRALARWAAMVARIIHPVAVAVVATVVAPQVPQHRPGPVMVAPMITAAMAGTT
jgi:hypothetical protein